MMLLSLNGSAVVMLYAMPKITASVGLGGKRPVTSDHQR